MNIIGKLSEDKYVAYLDVLGFKELVSKKGEKLNIYFEKVEESLKAIYNIDHSIDSQLVSDSIILSCELSDDKLRQLLMAVQTIQAKCALENIWIRGAITIGDIHFNKNPNIVVGNGLIEAYLLESQEKYPRIIINPKIVKNFDTRNKFLQSMNNKNIELIFEPDLSNNFIPNDSLFVSFAEYLKHHGKDNLEIIL